jgi:hypothetical protein
MEREDAGRREEEGSTVKRAWKGDIGGGKLSDEEGFRRMLRLAVERKWGRRGWGEWG